MLAIRDHSSAPSSIKHLVGAFIEISVTLHVIIKIIKPRPETALILKNQMHEALSTVLASYFDISDRSLGSNKTVIFGLYMLRFYFQLDN